MARYCALPACGVGFEPSRQWQKYCSPEHRFQHYQEQNNDRARMERLFQQTVAAYEAEGLTKERMSQIVMEEQP